MKFEPIENNIDRDNRKADSGRKDPISTLRQDPWEVIKVSRTIYVFIKIFKKFLITLR